MKYIFPDASQTDEDARQEGKVRSECW